jgi:hypothetical protein
MRRLLIIVLRWLLLLPLALQPICGRNLHHHWLTPWVHDMRLQPMAMHHRLPLHWLPLHCGPLHRHWNVHLVLLLLLGVLLLLLRHTVHRLPVDDVLLLLLLLLLLRRRLQLLLWRRLHRPTPVTLC